METWKPTTLSPVMLFALDALRVRGLSSYVFETFSLATWKALARRDLIELYMDADRTYITNLVLTPEGRKVTDAFQTTPPPSPW